MHFIASPYAFRSIVGFSPRPPFPTPGALCGRAETPAASGLARLSFLGCAQFPRLHLRAACLQRSPRGPRLEGRVPGDGRGAGGWRLPRCLRLVPLSPRIAVERGRAVPAGVRARGPSASPPGRGSPFARAEVLPLRLKKKTNIYIKKPNIYNI